jgi:hypothetical protein
MAIEEPIVLTGEDFTDGRLATRTGCTLVVAHANLVGVAPEKSVGLSDARKLLETALGTADDFPELQVALLNCLAYPQAAEQLSVYVSEYGTQCAALMFTDGRDPHFIVAGGNDTPATFHQWVLGILLASGARPTTIREEIVIRLAYDIAQPPEFDSPDPRWDDAEIRTIAILAARETLAPLYEEWVPGFDASALE